MPRRSSGPSRSHGCQWLRFRDKIGRKSEPQLFHFSQCRCALARPPSEKYIPPSEMWRNPTVQAGHVAARLSPPFPAIYSGADGAFRRARNSSSRTGVQCRPSYPTILEQPAPALHAFNRETAIAVKFDAMVKLGDLNSRMKDFFDSMQRSAKSRVNSWPHEQLIVAETICAALLVRACRAQRGG